MKPRVCILRTDGTNCDVETAYAVELAGGQPVMVHLNQLRRGGVKLTDFQWTIAPGGFSYGDDVASGKIMAVETIARLSDQVQELVAKRVPIMGICNGAQYLMHLGLLPYPKLGHVQATLTHNNSGHFQCQWVSLEPAKVTPCVFLRGVDTPFELQMANGEGRYKTDTETLERMQRDGLVALRYAQNPNGSQDAIAGVCDPTGSIFGLMPHPERFVHATQHPNWRRETHEPQGLAIFLNGVAYAKQL